MRSTSLAHRFVLAAPHRMKRTFTLALAGCALVLLGCSDDGSAPAQIQTTGGAKGSGGVSGTGGDTTTGSGGIITSGGTSATGGSSAAGGTVVGTGGTSGGVSSAGGESAAGGTLASGGTSTSTRATGGASGTGGVASAGGAAGQTAIGGTVGSGGQSGTGGVVSSGGRGGGAAGSTGTGGSAGASGGGGYPLKNPPVPSDGCGKPTTITTSTTYRTITSSGQTRQYMITMPPNYDMNKPYRYIYASHGMGGEGSDITREKYYNLQDIPEVANSTIFVSASGLGGSWGAKDVPLFDDILALVKKNACVDESRVFVLGFSFGGMYSYSLSMTRQKVIRAGIGMSPANFNISIPPKSHEPISWMQSTGMKDGTCPWVSNEAQKTGAKFIAVEHGTDNGCTVPNPIPTWKSGSMLCDDFAGCKPGYLTRICTFNGGHGLPFGSNHQATADWMWSFISQF